MVGDMTVVEINAAIAASFGWKIMFENRGIRPGWTSSAVEDCVSCPDYCHDLNAMHKAEKLLKGGLCDGDEWLAYVRLLHKITGGRGEQATARQRAESFVSTKGLVK